MTASGTFRDEQTHIHTFWETPMRNIADVLDWLCRLLHSYGFMLHHHGISFSVDYNSQKPLIKPCAAKAFCFFYNHLSLNEREAFRFTDQVSQRSRENQQAKYPINCSTPPNYLLWTEVCLWGTFSIRLVFLFNSPRCLITVWGVCIGKNFLTLTTFFGISVRPQLCLAFPGGDLRSRSVV